MVTFYVLNTPIYDTLIVIYSDNQKQSLILLNFDSMNTLTEFAGPPGHFNEISKREKEILELISQEYTTGEIAKKLFLGFETIKTYRKSLLVKLGAKNTAGLITKAFVGGILEIRHSSVLH